MLVFISWIVTGLGCILMVFGANLHIIHIKVTNVINSVKLFFKKSTDHLIIFVNLGNYEIIYLRFGGSHINRILMSDINRQSFFFFCFALGFRAGFFVICMLFLNSSCATAKIYCWLM